MIAWFAENMATIVVGIILVIILAAIVIHMVKERRSGKPVCGGNCPGCTKGGCHQDKCGV